VSIPSKSFLKNQGHTPTIASIIASTMATETPAPHNIRIAIDGFSGCGKSTTAKGVAKRLGYLYIDSGAMYRAVTLYFLRQGIPFDSPNPQMLAALELIDIHFERNEDTGLPEIVLNGEKVENEIRKPEIAKAVSPVSVHAPVRKAMVKLQQEMGAAGGIVMDGRDIGTVVFPMAELKVFMTANVEIRAQRRQAELAEKGIDVSLAEIIENLESRDRIDSSRAESPLRKAENAREIDTSVTSVEDQIDMVCAWAKDLLCQSK
jgi:CMP/dCMP kinase